MKAASIKGSLRKLLLFQCANDLSLVSLCSAMLDNKDMMGRGKNCILKSNEDLVGFGETNLKQWGPYLE